MLTKKKHLYKEFKRKTRRLLLQRSGKATGVFVFGAQRSGTNMLARIIDKNMAVECYHESDDEAFDRYVLRKERTKSLIEKSTAKIVLFKCISDSQSAKSLLDSFGNSRGIWIYRNYEDVVNSSLRRFTEHKKFLHYILFDPEKARWRAEGISKEIFELIRSFYTDKLTDASARALIWYIRNKFYFDQNLGADRRVKLVKYERLVTDPHDSFDDICRFLGISYYKYMTRNVKTSSIRKNNPPEINQEINMLCESLEHKFNDIVFEAV